MKECCGFTGNFTLLDREPDLREYCNVVISPERRALYDAGRHLITPSAYSRWPPHRTIEDYTLPEVYTQIGDIAPDDFYVFGGIISAHYGHFLLSTLSRLWCLDKFAKRPKIVCFRDVDHIFSIEYVSKTFEALGLRPSDFISFSKPTIVNRILVPTPAIEESNVGYRDFIRLCHRVGTNILELYKPRLPRSTKPVFLSKERLPSGVRRISNEQCVTRRLESAGFEIVYPETMRLEDQIALFIDREVVAGFAGSAFHTSVFAPGGRQYQISDSEYTNTSFLLCDTLNATSTVYLGLRSTDLAAQVTDARFHRVETLVDPVGVAELLLEILATDRQSRSNRTSADLVNVALNQPTTQSSFHPFVSPRLSATSGRIIGGPQVHTDAEDRPWWEVIFPLSDVSAIVVYNRCDGSDEVQDRARFLTIEVEDENGLAKIVYEHAGRPAFGGLIGTPLRWNATNPIRAQKVRISLQQRQYLHFDQVQVLGKNIKQ